jgi:hypothetical protein
MRFAVNSAGRAVHWSLAFLNRAEGSEVGMTPSPPAPTSVREEEQIREVVPARAVLTELARGFLLVRESDRERAVRFAVTFLREHEDRPARADPVPYPAAVPSERAFGRVPRGAVERPDPRTPP